MHPAQAPGIAEPQLRRFASSLSDFPAWMAANPIESTFATLRQRTTRTKNCTSRTTFLGLAFKLAEEAAKTWRRIRSPEKVSKRLGCTR